MWIKRTLDKQGRWLKRGRHNIHDRFYCTSEVCFPAQNRADHYSALMLAQELVTGRIKYCDSYISCEYQMGQQRGTPQEKKTIIFNLSIVLYSPTLIRNHKLYSLLRNKYCFIPEQYFHCYSVIPK